MAPREQRRARRSDGILSAEVVRRIDRLVGADSRAGFIRQAVEHALFLEEHISAHRAMCRERQAPDEIIISLHMPHGATTPICPLDA